MRVSGYDRLMIIESVAWALPRMLLQCSTEDLAHIFSCACQGGGCGRCCRQEAAAGGAVAL